MSRGYQVHRQTYIQNLDILLVKHFFDATQAGVYAVVALVGRIVYMLSWSVVSSMFPIVAEAYRRRREDFDVLGTALLLVFGICVIFIVGLEVAPRAIWGWLLEGIFRLLN